MVQGRHHLKCLRKTNLSGNALVDMGNVMQSEIFS